MRKQVNSTTQMLREREERYALAIAGTNDGIWDRNFLTGEVFRSPRWFEIVGYEPDEFDPGREAFTALIHPDDVEKSAAAFQAHLEARIPYNNLEFRLRHKSGEYIWVSANAQAVWGPDGKALRIAGSINDITERKRTEEALRESEGRFSSVFDNSPASISLKDLDGRFRLVNKRFLEWFGAAEQDVLGKTPAEALPGELANDSMAHDRKTLEAGEATEREQEIELASGRKALMVIAKFPVLNCDGEPIGIGTMITDVSEERRTAAELHHAHKMEAVGQLTGGLAHDFNNLLAVIMSNAQMMQRKLPAHHDLLDMVDPIVRATRRGAELSHRLLAFSRKQALQPKSIRPGVLCEGMGDLLKRSLGETIEVEINADDGTWDVLADPGQLENALLNLAINASHAMADGGNLTIRVENATVKDREWAGRWEGKPGEYVALSVADTGTGMAADVIERVFEPFFTTKEENKGSGLGLSMVHGFAQQSGGFTAIESEPGRGAMVTIYLPKAGPGRAAHDPHAPGREVQESRGETVLLVEDAADVRDVTAKLMEMLGYKVLVAQDGAGALAIASGPERIDFMLLDVVLPGGMNGIELCHRIREQRPGLKCVFMTGYSAIPDEDLPDGAELLSKPVAMDDLAATSRQVLDA